MFPFKAPSLSLYYISAHVCVYDSQIIMHVTRGNMMPMQPIRVVAYPHAYVYPMHPTHVRLHSGYPAASQELEQEISSIQRDDEPVERSWDDWDEMMGGHVELQCECLHHVANVAFQLSAVGDPCSHTSSQLSMLQGAFAESHWWLWYWGATTPI